MEAAGSGHVETVRLLLNSGADVNGMNWVSQLYAFHCVVHMINLRVEMENLKGDYTCIYVFLLPSLYKPIIIYYTG